MIIYPYRRIPYNIATAIPDGFAIRISDSGWITSTCYYEYIVNILYPRLVKNSIKFPVLILLDGHNSHINMDLHDFCVEHEILLYVLYPNTTPILQTCDVGIFHPLKIEWRKIIAQHIQSTTKSVTKFNFAQLFSAAFKNAINPKIIQSAFSACGIYPFNPKIIDYSKCISTRRQDLSNDYTPYANSQNLTNNNNTECLKIIESSMPADLLKEFKQAYDRHENPSSEELLYNIWKKLNVTVEESAIEEPDIEDPAINDANITAEKEDDNLDTTILPNTVSNITLNNLASESLEYDDTNLNDQTSNHFSYHDDNNNINDYIIYSSKSFEQFVILESTVNTGCDVF